MQTSKSTVIIAVTLALVVGVFAGSNLFPKSTDNSAAAGLSRVAVTSQQLSAPTLLTIKNASQTVINTLKSSGITTDKPRWCIYVGACSTAGGALACRDTGGQCTSDGGCYYAKCPNATIN